MAFNTRDCADWLAAETGYRDRGILLAAARSVGDTLASALAGMDMPATVRTQATVAAYGTGPCSRVGRLDRLAAPWAALVNGVAAHAAELDDNFMAAGTHGSAVLVPALLAKAEAIGADGVAVLEAFALGLQIQWRLSQVMNPAHGQLGWHPTSTIAAVGAAGACARLARLDGSATLDALNLSASMMAGSHGQFGYMAKPLHAGLAAKAGVLASDLAAAGVSAGPTALEAAVDLMGGAAQAGESPSDYGRPVALTALGVTMKIWPTCGSTHPAIQASLALAGAVRVDAIDCVVVSIPEILDANLKFRVPTNADQAKFSLEFAVAVALAERAMTQGALEGALWSRPDIAALMARIERRPVPDDYDDLRIAVEVTTTDAQSHKASASLDELPGTLAHPLSDAALIDKLRACAGGRLTTGQAERGWRDILALSDGAPLAPVLALYRLDLEA